MSRLDCAADGTTVQRTHEPPSPFRLRRLLRFIRLPGPERRALSGAAALVVMTRLALSVAPFRKVVAVADRLAKPRRSPATNDAGRQRMIWAVEAAARNLLPAGACLSQAIVADTLLRRRGYPSQLHLGVAHGPKGELKAHAWVESDGEVVIGGDESPAEFRPFPLMRPAR